MMGKYEREAVEKEAARLHAKRKSFHGLTPFEGSQLDRLEAALAEDGRSRDMDSDSGALWQGLRALGNEDAEG